MRYMIHQEGQKDVSSHKLGISGPEGLFRTLFRWGKAVVNVLRDRPDLKKRISRDRRSGRNIDQYIDSILRTMQSTRSPRAREALQEKLFHVEERLRKFVKRRQTDRRSG